MSAKSERFLAMIKGKKKGSSKSGIGPSDDAEEEMMKSSSSKKKSMFFKKKK